MLTTIVILDRKALVIDHSMLTGVLQLAGMVGMPNNLPDIDSRQWLLDNQLARIIRGAYHKTERLDQLIQALLTIPKAPQDCDDYVASDRQFLATSGGMFELMSPGEVIYPQDELSFILKDRDGIIQTAGGVVIPPRAHCVTYVECYLVITELVAGYKHLTPEIDMSSHGDHLVRFKLHL